MFRDSSNGIQEYTTSVTSFINKCIEDVVPTVTVRTYPNQKPWITGNIRTELKDRAAPFKERDTNPDTSKKSRYALRRTIKEAKRQYRTKIESITPAMTLVGCVRACKLLGTIKGNPAVSYPVTRAYQTSEMPFMLALRQATLKHA
jgi:hypothetical protein